ncbi:Rz1-like lysis system protein LysC [Providencia hangzhouensis]|uniref:Rz1-like lysis system protein LysC n=1 Tax=Providencia hangzhouensis TaxID=3031799 RepID=UPI003F691967
MLLCLSLLLMACSSTQTNYVPAQCVPIPATLTNLVVPPLPPDSDGKTLSPEASVLWNRLLLGTIEKANEQLEAIREIEYERNNTTKK